MTTTFSHPRELLDAVGTELGPGEWFPIEQDRIDRFADATDDHQWIHVDPQRAASGPFGAPIAHGYLTLSLLPSLTHALLDVGGIAMAVNYGLDSVRFLQPVVAGSRVRARSTVVDVSETPRGIRVTQRVTVEIDGVEKPALVADAIALLVPAT
jgi:acyl dehydratase